MSPSIQVVKYSSTPMSSWLDLLPSHERQKLRELKKRSPEEYAKLREKIKSVEQIGEEMDRNKQLADFSFALEMEPKLKEALKSQIESDISEQGIEGVLFAPEGLSEEAQAAVNEGFDISVDTNPETQKDQILVHPEGNVSEKIPIKFSLSEQYVQQFVDEINA